MYFWNDGFQALETNEKIQIFALLAAHGVVSRNSESAYNNRWTSLPLGLGPIFKLWDH